MRRTAGTDRRIDRREGKTVNVHQRETRADGAVADKSPRPRKAAPTFTRYVKVTFVNGTSLRPAALPGWIP